MPVLSLLQMLFYTFSFTQLSRWHPTLLPAAIGSLDVEFIKKCL